MINCPLVENNIITEIDYLENSDIAEGMIKESSLPEKFKIDNWREICLICKNHRYD